MHCKKGGQLQDTVIENYSFFFSLTSICIRLFINLLFLTSVLTLTFQLREVLYCHEVALFNSSMYLILIGAQLRSFGDMTPYICHMAIFKENLTCPQAPTSDNNIALVVFL